MLLDDAHRQTECGLKPVHKGQMNMGNESMFEVLHRVAIIGEASPEESFLVFSCTAMVIFAVIAFFMLMANRARNRRKRLERRQETYIYARFARA